MFANLPVLYILIDKKRGGSGRRALQALSTALLLTLASSASFAATITVAPDGTGDAPTIQAAVAMADDGDVISLTDGVFTGDGNRGITTLGKSIRIESQSGAPESCTIDVEGSESIPHRAFVLDAVSTLPVEFANLTLRGGYAASDLGGGAVLLAGTEAVFDGCVFESNTGGDLRPGGVAACTDGASAEFRNCVLSQSSARQGGAVSVIESSARFDACRFEANIAGIDGGALFGLTAAIEITESSFAGNAARFGGALFFDNDSAVEVRSSLFDDNSAEAVGGAIAVSASDPTISQCTFLRNSANGFKGEVGGAIWCSFSSNPKIEFCLMAFQSAGGAVGCEKASGPELECCDLFGNEGGDWEGQIAGQLGQNGNFSADPLLCDFEAGDYRLAAGSPCLPPGNECAAIIGRFGMGCEGVPVFESSWGQIKTRFTGR